MVDLSSLVQDPALGAGSFLVNRSTRFSHHGETVEIGSVTSPAAGSIQPGTPEKATLLPEEYRSERFIVVYSTYPLSTGESTAEQYTAADRISWRGKFWRVVSVMPWHSFGWVRALAILDPS